MRLAWCLLWLWGLAWAQLPTLPAPDAAQNWSTLVSPHFRVHFHQGLETTAQEVAHAAELAYQDLRQEFEQAFDSWDIVITDGPDYSNGFADPLGRRVVLYTAHFRLSDDFSARIGWWRMVVFHELVHAFDMYQAKGLYANLRRLVGNTIAPTMVKPYSITEGLAVYTKYRYLGHSRFNDPRTRMVLRQMVLDNRLPSLAQASRLYSRSEWPGSGFVVYNYASWFMDYLEETFGRDLHSRFTSLKASGTDDDEALKELTQQNLEQLYGGFVAWLKSRLGPEISALQQNPTPFTQLTQLGHYTESPVFLPDGSLVYSHSSPRRNGLRWLKNGVDQELALSGSFPTVSPDGSQVVYSRFVGDQRDLYSYNFKDQSTQRITTGERAYLARFAPNGSLYYARNTPNGTSQLWQRSPQGAARMVRDLAPATLHSLDLHPSGQSAVLAVSEGGFQDLYLLDLANGTWQRLTQDTHPDADPVFSTSGQQVFFSSDRSGVHEIYALEPASMRLWQVTRSVGGAFFPAVQGNRLVYVGYGSGGYNLFQSTLNPQSWQAVNLTAEPLPHSPEQVAYPVQAYNPLPQLWPPQLRLPQTLGSGLGLYLQGADPVEVHRYNLTLAWDFAAATPAYEVFYQWRGTTLEPTLGLAGSAEGHWQRLDLNLSEWLAGASLSYTRQTYTNPQLPTKQSLGAAFSVARGGGAETQRWRSDLSFFPGIAVREGQNPFGQMALEYQAQVNEAGKERLTLNLIGGLSGASLAQDQWAVGGSGRFGLRSHPTVTRAAQAARGTVAWEFALGAVEATLPWLGLFVDDVWGGVFAEAAVGNGQLRSGLGAEIGFGLGINYTPPIGVVVGLAYGLNGQWPTLYLNLGVPVLGQ